MSCWLCHRMRPDRGGLCHDCRKAIQPDFRTPRSNSRLLLAAVLAAMLSVAASMVFPVIALPPDTERPVTNIAAVRQQGPPQTPAAYETVMVTEQVKRKVYPYSIVPGG